MKFIEITEKVRFKERGKRTKHTLPVSTFINPDMIMMVEQVEINSRESIITLINGKTIKASEHFVALKKRIEDETRSASAAEEI